MAERICSMQGCKKKHQGRGLCAAHLAKARREGKLPDGAEDRYPPGFIDRLNQGRQP
jgi:hypothetical protein